MDVSAPLQGKRVTLKRSHANPLFEQWLEELYEEAKAKKSKLEPLLKQAFESICKYPLSIKTGRDCIVLKGFDKKLCTFLDKRIEVYNYQYNRHDDAEFRLEDIEPKPNCNGGSRDALSSSQSETDCSSSNSFHQKQPIRKKSKSFQSENRKNESSGSSFRKKNCITESEIDNSSQTSHSSTNSNSVNPKSRKQYKPAFRSGSYGILIALLEQLTADPDNPSLEKDKLIEKAQPHSEESFTRPKPESFYTAWSNMSRLVSKGLVKQVRSKKCSYSLTDEGICLAIELSEIAKNTPTANDIIFNGASTSNIRSEIMIPKFLESGSSSAHSSQATSMSQSQRSSNLTYVELPAGSFDVILLIDKNETGGVNNKKDPTVAQFNKFPDLKHEYRSLKVGDFTWIARHKQNKDQEIVLPYVVERKRMDDLGHSIKDGRFHEQKFRLRKCGLANVIYMVENYGSNKYVGLPVQTLMQAIANTRVQDKFKIHVTESLSNSARFLAMMTKRITIEYKENSLIGTDTDPQGEELMTFSYFNKSAVKNKPLTVTEIFIKLLLQLKGVSVEKALAITTVYNTPKKLIDEYEKHLPKEGQILLANLKYGNLNRSIGPTVSKAIYNFFSWID